MPPYNPYGPTGAMAAMPGMRWDATLNQWVPEDDVDPVANPAAMAARPDDTPVVPSPPVANPAAMADRPDVVPIADPAEEPVVAPVADPAAMADRPEFTYSNTAGEAASDMSNRPGAGMTQAELADFMESTLGTTPGDFVAGDETADMDADGDGRVSQAELEAYQGNVYQYDVPDPALTGVDPLNQMVLDYMGGTGTLPGIANFMDDLDIRHEQQDADFQQSLVNRGITDSTIADNMRRQHERNQANERAMLETNLMQNLVPLYTQTGTTYEGLLDQDRAQSLGEFFQFLDRQTQENRWTDQQKSQALSLMLNALGIGTINPQMPGFSIPAGQPGAGQSIGTLLGNLGTAYLGNPQADLSWLGM